MKEHGGTLIAIDANREKRYERINGRGSALDQVSFEEFCEQEEREMHSDDPNKQNIAKVMEMADVVIHNDGTLDDLHREVEKILARVTRT